MVLGRDATMINYVAIPGLTKIDPMELINRMLSSSLVFCVAFADDAQAVGLMIRDSVARNTIGLELDLLDLNYIL